MKTMWGIRILDISLQDTPSALINKPHKFSLKLAISNFDKNVIDKNMNIYDNKPV